MLKRSGLTLINTLFGFAAVSGWIVCATGAYTLMEAKQEARQFAELNEVMLADVRALQSPGTIATKALPLPSDPTDKMIEELKQRNLVLRDELTDLKDASQEQIRSILKRNPIAVTESRKDHVPLSKATHTVQLGTLTVSDKGAVFQTQKSPDGQIISVDPEKLFVVINLGERAGVKRGSEFEVMIGAQIKATLKAVRVRELLSACEIECKTDGCVLSPDEPVYFSRKS